VKMKVFWFPEPCARGWNFCVQSGFSYREISQKPSGFPGFARVKNYLNEKRMRRIQPRRQYKKRDEVRTMVQTNTTMNEQHERAREEALAKLVALLEGDSPHPRQTHSPSTLGKPNPLSQLARLQAARAAYSLANTGDMERVHTNAYFRHRGHVD
jgi:hypothetical protein